MQGTIRTLSDHRDFVMNKFPKSGSRGPMYTEVRRPVGNGRRDQADGSGYQCNPLEASRSFLSAAPSARLK